MRRSVVLLGAALALAGCAPAGGPGPALDGTESAQRTPAPTAAATGTRTCGEPSPDRGPVDLHWVRLTPAATGYTVTFQLAGRPTSVPGVLELSLGIWSADGAADRSLDVRWVDGVPGVRMYDTETAQETTLPVRPEEAGGTVIVHFPAAATDGLGRSWRWEAFASVDGTSLDDCPAR